MPSMPGARIRHGPIPDLRARDGRCGRGRRPDERGTDGFRPSRDRLHHLRNRGPAWAVRSSTPGTHGRRVVERPGQPLQNRFPEGATDSARSLASACQLPAQARSRARRDRWARTVRTTLPHDTIAQTPSTSGKPRSPFCTPATTARIAVPTALARRAIGQRALDRLNRWLATNAANTINAPANWNDLTHLGHLRRPVAPIIAAGRQLFGRAHDRRGVSRVAAMAFDVVCISAMDGAGGRKGVRNPTPAVSARR